MVRGVSEGRSGLRGLTGLCTLNYFRKSKAELALW